jgi:hypothetical protein
LTFLATGLAYLLERVGFSSTSGLPDISTVGIVYLCCDDVDPEALESLANLRHAGDVLLIVHDDSRSASARAEVDYVVEDLRRRYDREVLLLRRPNRDGGKPAALNYVLNETGHLYPYFLLCDNDSVAVDRDAISKALSYFADPRIAIVQCRNVAVAGHGYSVNRLLSRSIDVSHAFLRMQARFGWSLFIGHNAFLRTKAVIESGAFTPGVFADDLDLAVRLNVRGERIVYAPEIRFAEDHPRSYEAFRRRAYKWSYGCMQVLKAHAGRVLASPELNFAEKLSFFSFAGFYVGQTALLAYLFVRFLVRPVLLPHQHFDILSNLTAGIAIMSIIYAPAVCYFMKERRLLRSSGSVLLCGLVYGTTDFVCAKAVKDCVLGRVKPWVPTNAVSSGESNTGVLYEALFGLGLLLTSLVLAPELLYQPCSYLFLGKFLFGPAISLLYRDHESDMARKPTWAGNAAASPSGSTFLGLGLVAVLILANPTVVKASSSVSISGKQILVEGRPFLVKGMHYGPWRPGTGPGKTYPYPSPGDVDSDLRLIGKLNVNTILVYDPPQYLLDLADRNGLKVLYALYLEWWTVGSPKGAALRESILQRVRKESSHPALLGWVVGNEIPMPVLESRGADVEAGLADLYHSIKAVDATHPVMHSNWPLGRNLRLDYFDVAAYNVYPLWPPEVVAMGFGNYIHNILQPIAAAKPLLVTEFGANSLEANEEGQATLLKRCWKELVQAGACGGVVFEFADEWWKNYDNPRIPGIYWDRKVASDDEKTHDQDPEEYYGIVTGERRAKLAYAAVRDMFAPEVGFSTADSRLVPGAVTATLLALAFGAWAWGQRKVRHARRTMHE